MTYARQLPIIKSPDILSGTPVFAGTRVPIKNLLDYMRAGESIPTFLADFPSVSHADVEAILTFAEAMLMETVNASSA